MVTRLKRRSSSFNFVLTALAGLSTGIGCFLAFFTERTNRTFLSTALGFSAGVMIYVSLVEIFVKAQDTWVQVHDPQRGAWLTVGAFCGNPFFPPVVFGLIFAAVAGIMVFLSLDELLPTGKEYRTGHVAIYGLIAGMAVMALSLLLYM